MSDTLHKAQFAIIPMWVHRRIVATRTRTIAHAVYTELVGQYAGSKKDADGLQVWPEVQQIADSLGVPKSSVTRALAVLIDCGVVLRKRTVRRNRYWLPQEDPGEFTANLDKFQKVTSDSPQKVRSDSSRKVTSDSPQKVTSDALYNPDPSNPDPSNPDPTLFDTPPSQTPVSSPPVMEGFDAFWAAYPRKIGKVAAEAAWKKAIKRNANREHIIGFITQQADAWTRNGKDPQYIPHASTWLNGSRYLEEIDTTGSSQPAGHQTYRNPTDNSAYYESI